DDHKEKRQHRTFMEFTDTEITDYEKEFTIEHMQPTQETMSKSSAKKNEMKLELRRSDFE
ncbi:hypothetical protein ACJMK2_041837, partial [Sinanodonta woodiana]